MASTSRSTSQLSVSSYQPNAAFISKALPLLPPELWSLIFVGYAEQDGAYWSSDWMRLMRVCRLFREVGLAQAELWSYVTLPLYQPSQIACRAIGVRLGYAKGWPLSVRLVSAHMQAIQYDEGTFPWPPAAVVRLVMDTNGPMSWHGPEVAKVLSILARSKYPNLHSFAFRPYRPPLAPLNDVSVLFTPGVAPALRNLTLPFVPTFEAPSDLTSLHRFRLTFSSVDRTLMFDLANFVQRCPSLRFLDMVHVTEQGVPKPPTVYPFTAPSYVTGAPLLERFTLVGDVQLAEAVLECIPFPRTGLELYLTSWALPFSFHLENLVRDVTEYIQYREETVSRPCILVADRYHVVLRDGPDGDTAILYVGFDGCDLNDIKLEHAHTALVYPVLLNACATVLDTRMIETSRGGALRSSSMSLRVERGCTVVLYPSDILFWTLDVLRSLLRGPPSRTQVACLILDLSDSRQYGYTVIEASLRRITVHLEDARKAGQPVTILEFQHGSNTGALGTTDADLESLLRTTVGMLEGTTTVLSDGQETMYPATVHLASSR